MIQVERRGAAMAAVAVLHHTWYRTQPGETGWLRGRARVGVSPADAGGGPRSRAPGDLDARSGLVGAGGPPSPGSREYSGWYPPSSPGEDRDRSLWESPVSSPRSPLVPWNMMSSSSSMLGLVPGIISSCRSSVPKDPVTENPKRPGQRVVALAERSRTFPRLFPQATMTARIPL
jgi:hypothetical protein